MIGRSGRATLLGQPPEALAALGYAFAERAAIHEHDGGLPREEAERLAWEHVQRTFHAIVGGAANPEKGVTRHWRPPQPDRNVLST